MQNPLTDSENRSWTLGPSLGTGLWGESFRLQGPDGATAVLKVPLTADDPPLRDLEDPAEARALAAACQAAADHQAQLLVEAHGDPAVGDLLATVITSDGRTALVLPEHPAGLATLRGAWSVAQVVGVALTIARKLAEAPRPHGQLHPSNVFVTEDGGVTFTDWQTDPIGETRSRLAELAGRRVWGSPQGLATPAVAEDVWALARWMVGALAPDLFAPWGLDNDAAREVRDQICRRLVDAAGPTRFADRTADRLSTLLARALSVESEPSPPYRFHAWSDVIARLEAVHALLEPEVIEVGPVVWSAWRPEPRFGAAEPVAFSVRVACTPGVDEPDDVVCGLRVQTEEDPPRRLAVPGAAVQVRPDREGQVRFRLELPPLPAGSYRVVAAFAIEGTGALPSTTEAAFVVDPAAEATPSLPPLPEPLSAFAADRTTLVPEGPPTEPSEDAGFAADGRGPLPDPRLDDGAISDASASTAPGGVRPAVGGTDDGTFSLPHHERVVPQVSGDRGVAWVLSLSAALAALAVLSYVARSC